MDRLPACESFGAFENAGLARTDGYESPPAQIYARRQGRNSSWERVVESPRRPVPLGGPRLRAPQKARNSRVASRVPDYFCFTSVTQSLTASGAATVSAEALASA